VGFRGVQSVTSPAFRTQSRVKKHRLQFVRAEFYRRLAVRELDGAVSDWTFEDIYFFDACYVPVSGHSHLARLSGSFLDPDDDSVLTLAGLDSRHGNCVIVDSQELALADGRVVE